MHVSILLKIALRNTTNGVYKQLKSLSETRQMSLQGVNVMSTSL